MNLFIHLHQPYQQYPFQYFQDLDEILSQISRNLAHLAAPFAVKKLLFMFDSMIQKVKTYDFFS